MRNWIQLSQWSREDGVCSKRDRENESGGRFDSFLFRKIYKEFFQNSGIYIWRMRIFRRRQRNSPLWNNVWWNESKTSQNHGEFEEKNSSHVNFSFRCSVFFFFFEKIVSGNSFTKYNLLRYYNKYNNLKKIKCYKIKNVSIQQTFKHNFQCFVNKIIFIPYFPILPMNHDFDISFY